MLSVCMIVKNEAEPLKLTLPQLVKCGAEVIVVDTGSSDNTVEVAQDLGAKVYHFKWVDDFAAARNYSISLATQPWILWLDADECVKEDDLRGFTSLLEKAPSSVQGYETLITESSYGETKQGLVGYHRVKVFRNSGGYHFVKPINEQLVDEKGASVKGERSDIVIYHWGGHLSEEKMKHKRERYYALYEKHLQKNPNDPYVAALYAGKLSDDQRYDEALGYYSRAWENGSNLQVGLDALVKKCELELKLRRYKEAMADVKEILARDPMNAGAKNTLATILMGAQKSEVAIELLEEMLKSALPGLDIGREQIIPRVILSKAYRIKGDERKADMYEQEAERLKEQTGVNAA